MTDENSGGDRALINYAPSVGHRTGMRCGDRKHTTADFAQSYVSGRFFYSNKQPLKARFCARNLVGCRWLQNTSEEL